MDSALPAPAGATPIRYWFAGFRLEADGTLLNGERPQRLPPEELAVLRVLLARDGKVVSPLELKRAIWGPEPVARGIVSRCIASLRARLEPADCIENVSKRGYRLAVAVQKDGRRPASELPRLVILPFTAGFGVPEYLGPAVAEQTMGQLNSAQPATVAVAARDSSFALARNGLAAQEIGKALDGQLVLAGRVDMTPRSHRLRAEMLRTDDGAQLWIEDLFVERGQTAELSTELVTRLTSRLQSGGHALSAVAPPKNGHKTPPQDDEAYELYLRAHHDWQTLERHRMQDAMVSLQRAIELDPKLITARADLAYLYVFQALHGFMAPTIAAQAVHHTALHIPESAGSTDALLPALGWIEFSVDRDMPAALDAFSRTEHLPHNPWITRVRSMFLLSRHRFDEAVELLREAIRLDPYSAWLPASLAWALHLAGEREASVEVVNKALALWPEHESVCLFGAAILAYNDEPMRAVEVAEGLVARSPHLDLAIGVHAYALARLGSIEEALTLLERLQWLTRERFVLNAFNAAVHAALGEIDGALDELRAANDIRCPWFFQMLADPRLDRIKTRPQYNELLGELKAMESDAEKPEPQWAEAVGQD